jgi:hypothetical protein
MLILTLSSGRDQYTGSQNPFITALNTGSPSPLTPYSRDMRNILAPNTDSEFLLQRKNGDWVRFEEEYSWCRWDNTGECHGATSHIQFTKGTLYDSDGNAVKEGGSQHAGSGMHRFNGCMYVGCCAAGSGDAVGFGSGES